MQVAHFPISAASTTSRTSTGLRICTFLIFIMMNTGAALSQSEHSLKRVVPWELPKWAAGFLKKEPSHGRIPMANLPTPLHRVLPVQRSLSSNGTSVLKKIADNDISLFIKRDDMSGGVELGGNKIRKLEFLLADALKQGCDSVVTIGGEQSNHCRATASAARMVGMEPHLILRTNRADALWEGMEDFGVTGNIMINRIVGSSIYTCTPGEYGRVGSKELVKRVCQYLQSSDGGNHNAYAIPVGGSNAIGSFGYIQAVDELMAQWDKNQGPIDHIVFACGSGGTAAGIALGIALAHGALDKSDTTDNQDIPTVHAIGVCDNPDYFYAFVSNIADGMGLSLPSDMSTEVFLRRHMVVHQGKGLGYAVSTDEELDFVCQFAQETGIALDPVYSGKALYNFVTGLVEGPDSQSFRGKNVLFWHTGGALGLYASDLTARMARQSPVKRLDVYGKNMENAVDVKGAE